MLDNQERELAGTDEKLPHAAPAVVTEEAKNGTAVGGQADSPNWHAEAGRKGALRIHQLIQEGRLYEKEHGLTRGRQRIRQLIQEGKLYEKEHGLRTGGRASRARTPRLSSDQLLSTLLHSLVRLSKPKFRAQLVQLLQSLETGFTSRDR